MPNDEDRAMGSTATVASNQVSIKPPAFMETAINGWFSTMEAQFHLKKITLCYLILPPATLNRLAHTVIASEDYDQLKQSIKSSYEKTKPELFSKLISSQLCLADYQCISSNLELLAT